MCMFGNGERGVTLLHLRLIVFHFHLSPHHFDRRSFRSVGWSVSSSLPCMLCHHIPSDCVCLCVLYEECTMMFAHICFMYLSIITQR